jgi:hypothetical protein
MDISSERRVGSDRERSGIEDSPRGLEAIEMMIRRALETQEAVLYRKFESQMSEYIVRLRGQPRDSKWFCV